MLDKQLRCKRRKKTHLPEANHTLITHHAFSVKLTRKPFSELRLLQTFVGFLQKKKIRTRAVFKETPKKLYHCFGFCFS